MQQLFPMSQFIVVLRHPEAVAASVASWVHAPAQALIDHWIAAQVQMLDDLPYLHAVMVLRYEDIVADASRALRRIARFTDLPEAALPEGIADGNQTHAGATQMTKAHAAEGARWGYAPGLQVSPWPGLIQHPLRAVREAVEAA